MSSQDYGNEKILARYAYLSEQGYSHQRIAVEFGYKWPNDLPFYSKGGSCYVSSMRSSELSYLGKSVTNAQGGCSLPGS